MRVQRVVIAGVRLAKVLEEALTEATAAEAAVAAAAQPPADDAGWGRLAVGVALGWVVGGLLSSCFVQRRNARGRQPRQKLRIYSPVARRDAMEESV